MPELKKTTSKTRIGPYRENHQASTNYSKLHIEAVIESEARTTAMQHKIAAKLSIIIGLRIRHAECHKIRLSHTHTHTHMCHQRTLKKAMLFQPTTGFLSK